MTGCHSTPDIKMPHTGIISIEIIALATAIFAVIAEANVRVKLNVEGPSMRVTLGELGICELFEGLYTIMTLI